MLVNYRLTAVCLLFVSFIVNLQSQNKKFAALDELFYDYNIVTFNTSEIMSELSKRSYVYKTKMLGWDITLDDSGIIDDRYQCVTFDGIKTTPQPKTTARAMNGYTSQGGRVSLTFNHHFIQGFIQTGMFTFYIESVSNFDKNAEKDLFVVYNPPY